MMRSCLMKRRVTRSLFKNITPSHCEASLAEAIYRSLRGLWIECPALGFRK